MKILREHIIVKVPSVFFDETQYTGMSGKKIIQHVLFNPERHVRNFGIITSVPDELFRYPLLSNHTGAPNYHDHNRFEWKTNEDIELELEVGDKVYFHHNALLPDQQGKNWNKLFLKSTVEEGKVWHYFRIKYDIVFGSVRYVPKNSATREWDWINETKLTPLNIPGVNETRYIFTDLAGCDHIYEKKVVMIGSYTFIEPDKETWEEISIPVAETLNGRVVFNPDGSQRLKPKEQWIVTKSAPGDKYLCGWVRYTGSPLKGDKAFLTPGDYVYFQHHANTRIRFEGQDFFRMRQRHILAIDYTKSNIYESV